MTVEDFRLSSRCYGQVRVITCRATHYFSDARGPMLALADSDIAAEGISHLVFDLDGVIFLSSSTLRVLAEMHKKLSPSGGQVVTAGGGEVVRSVLKFLPFVRQYDDLKAALAALSEEAARIHGQEGA